MNHTGAASGAEFALMRLAEGLRADHAVAVACPEGPLADMVDAAQVERFDLPRFEASLRLHPVHTPAELLRLGPGGVALLRAARRFGAQLLHSNTPRAGLIAGIAARLGGPPVVVRAHEALPESPLGRTIRFALVHSAAEVVTVSQDTARRFNEGLERPLASAVYNSFDRDRFDPERVAPAPVREELGIDPDAALLGQVAQVTPWKGQDTAIRALAKLRLDGLDAHLLLVGDVAFAGRTVRYDNQGFLRSLHRLVDELDMRAAVHFLGRRDDVPGLLRALDLSLLPSWDEPFANVMLESMAMRTPLLVTAVGGGPELVEDGVSGRLLPPKQPELWAAAARELLTDPERLARMGRRAREATERFNDEAHAREMLRVYRRVLAEDGQPPAGRQGRAQLRSP